MIQVPSVWTHREKGGVYVTTDVATHKADAGDYKVVLYRRVSDGQLFSRSVSEFLGRFRIKEAADL